MKIPTPSGNSGTLLSLKDVAAWQIAGIRPDNPDVRAALPALQRGAVWRAPQIEDLWDSVVRGFPVGAFLLAPYRQGKGIKPFLYGQGTAATAATTHHLLDGQQRSNALALGFLNPWRPAGTHTPPAALWIDLEAPDPKDEREVVFRVLTRSHPWGYRYDSMAGDGPRLSAQATRDAGAAYAASDAKLQGKGAGEIPLTAAWPWDARAPLPLCLLLDAVEAGGDVAGHVRRALAKLPFWKEGLANANSPDWSGRVLEIVGAKSGDDRERFERIVDRFGHLLGKPGTGSYQIPALVVPEITSAFFRAEPTPRKASPEDADRQDPMETLFVRINSSGTPLEGEELVYSILKSIWPEAERHVDAIHARLARPSRIVVLAARLVLATEKAYKERPPAAPDVSRFRRLVNGVDRESPRFRDKILAFFESGKAAKVFDTARALLTDNRWCPLPGVLVADVARRSQDVMFLLLRWVQRLLDEKEDPAQLGKVATLRALGAVTALAWFSENEGHCLTTLWPQLQTASERTLPHVLSKSFDPCFGFANGKPVMIPLVPPKVLQTVFTANMLERHGFGTPNGSFWQSWNWEYVATPAVDDKYLGDKLSGWYRGRFKKAWTLQDEDRPDENGTGVDGRYQQVWSAFVHKLRHERRLLLFAQRSWLARWFPGYDPTAPDQLDEHDRPWDFDHIHPASYISRRKNVPDMIRAWHSSIGNLRVWPFQANRGDGDSPPRVKLATKPYLQAFHIHTPGDLLDASFLEEGDELDHWHGSTPRGGENDWFPAGYLGDGDSYGSHRPALLRAILGRLLRVYTAWYDTLLIDDLYA